MRKQVVKLLQELDAFAVENPCLPGTPDINCTLGWIECKKMRAWPKRAGTVVRLDHHLTPQQRIWLSRRCRKNGRAFVLLQVANDFLLLWGATAAEQLEKLPKRALIEAAIFQCSGWAELEKKLIIALKLW
jgi:hypothetical protein